MLKGCWEDDIHIHGVLNGMKDHTFFDIYKRFYTLRCWFEAGVCLTAKPDKVSRENDLKYWTCWKELYTPNDKYRKYYVGKLTEIRLTVFITTDFFVITFRDKEPFITTRNHFLLLSDLLTQRSVLLLSSLYARVLRKINYLHPHELFDVFKLGDDLLIEFGNEVYSSLGVWESMIIGFILRKTQDEYTDFDKFHLEMEADFINSQGPPYMSFLQSYYNDRILPLFKRLRSPQKLMQAFGLYRIWGHPTIDQKEGIRKLKSVACRHRATSSQMISLLNCKWREYLYLNYFSNHKKWPNILFPTNEECDSRVQGSYLLTQLQSGAEVSTTHKDYQLNDWKLISFGKTFEIPSKFELSEMISDKAMSHGNQTLRECCETTGTIGKSQDRSVIIQWLQNNYNDPVEFLSQVSLNGFGEDEIVVGVHPKERELSRQGRYFGLLTLKKRLYVVVTEALLAEHVLRYFPEITMTMDATSLNNKLFQNTRDQSEERNKYRPVDHVSVVVNMDFNKWNSFMREDETLPLFEDFDGLFGLVNVFSRTHEMFKDSTLYLADGTYTPQFNNNTGLIIESDFSWRGHLGGIEG